MEQADNRQAQLHEFKKNISINTFMSIPFLALNYYDSIYLIIYIVITVALLIYKVQNLVMPAYAITIETIILVLFSLTQYIRYKIGDSAVNQKQPKKVIFFMVSSLFVILIYVFQIRLQTYILLSQVILGCVGLGLTALQFLSAIWLLKVFFRKKNAP